jgi:hypothetical protein
MCQVVSYTDSCFLLSMLQVVHTTYFEVTSLGTKYVLVPVYDCDQFYCLIRRLRFWNTVLEFGSVY